MPSPGSDPAPDAAGRDIVPTAEGQPEPAAAASLPRPTILAVAGGALLLAAFTALGDASEAVQRFLPGTVAGFFLLTVALALLEGRAPAAGRSVARGLVPLARTLLHHMGLLFVPAGVAGVTGLFALPTADAVPVAAALVGSTLLGLVVIGGTMRALG